MNYILSSAQISFQEGIGKLIERHRIPTSPRVSLREADVSHLDTLFPPLAVQRRGKWSNTSSGPARVFMTGARPPASYAGTALTRLCLSTKEKPHPSPSQHQPRPPGHILNDNVRGLTTAGHANRRLLHSSSLMPEIMEVCSSKEGALILRGFP